MAAAARGSRPSVYPFIEQGFTAELQRRGTLMIGGGFTDPRTQPDQVLARELDAFVCEQRAR